MVSPSPEHTSTTFSGSHKRLTMGLLMSISSLMALWAKHATKVSTKLKTTATKSLHHRHHHDGDKTPRLLSPKSPIVVRPKQLVTQISNKAISFIHNKKRANEDNDVVADSEQFGDGGVWQKAILMGDKCQPLDFSGVIYYDSCGKQLNEIPLRSPRASPMPGYSTRGKLVKN
ncbi:uncharacterized protein LOC110615917 [Manihot esculenta]|uniref:Uncharacterized protein n=1 Tax=Manihot esculenta TaxID=3983 RepID=A0A2C9VVJ4_MANES|nr:uncharacterized protein LOC110615917 [Manihot esculenta]OAY50225.1 hypothetical protein MANES_05G118500v8 [Manihot esculenta]